MILTDLLIAIRNLAQHTRRNVFLGGAIAAVTALLVLLGALSAGIRSTILESSTVLMTGHVNVGGFYKVTSGSAAPFVTGYEKVLEEARRHVPELDFATVRGRGYAKAVSDTSSMDLILGGLDIAKERDFLQMIRPIEGSLDDLTKPDTILLFQDQAKRLQVKVGDAITLSAPTARGMANAADVRVAAIAKNMGLLSSWNAFMPNETIERLYQLRPGTTGAIHLYLKDPAASAQVAARLRTALSEGGWRVMEADPRPYWEKLMGKVTSEDWTGQKLDVTTWEDEMSFIQWILQALQGLMGLLVGILMVIVVIGIMNTLWIAIRERTREIGTLRAIGMQRSKVLELFLLEAGLLGLAGTLLGAGVGVATATLLTAAHIGVPEGVQVFLMTQFLTLKVNAGSVVFDVVAISVTTTLAGLYPSLRAARLRPVTAMRHAG